jgi:fructose-1,6-bisphosphatase/inositol monophosphatase family enzyme
MAYEQQDEIVFGAIALPSLSRTVYAETGKGCWANGKPAHVSSTTELRGAHVMATWLEDWDLALLTRMRDEEVIIRTWGDAYGYALVATGQADAIVDHTAGVYDLGPMPVIIEEAGGKFSSKNGVRAIDQGDAVASNGIIHDSVLALLEKG